MKLSSYKFFTLILILLYNTVTLPAQDADHIDIDILFEIEADLIREIGESEEFIPGFFQEMVLTPDGTIIIADRQHGSIEQFNAEGAYMGRVAREGNGPGELPSMFTLVDAGGEGFMVWKSQSLIYDIYTCSENNLYRLKQSKALDHAGDQRIDVIGYLEDSGYLAFFRSWRDEIRIDLPEYKREVVRLYDQDMVLLQDSLHLIKTANHIFKDPSEFSTNITMGGLSWLGLPPFRFEDQIKVMNNDFYIIARPDSAAISVYNNKHELINKIKLSIKKRAISSEDLKNAFETHPVAKNSIRARNVLSSYTKNYKPPFLDVWYSKDRILLHTDNTGGSKEMVLLTVEGTALGKFYLHENDEITYFRENRVYTIHRNPMSGHSVRIYEVGIE